MSSSDRPFPLFRVGLAAALAVVLSGVVVAAPPDPDVPPPALPPSPATPQVPADPSVPPRLTEAQLDELVAPIALYPDVVLSSLLPATTAPFDVVAAARHVAENKGAVDAPPEGTAWEPGVVSLLQYPEVLTWMNENLPWVEAMGAAVATQQEEVLAAIQRYRALAKRAGALRTDEHLVVREEPVPATLGAPAGTTTIVIVPADPQIVYVPVYDPWPILQVGWVWSPVRPYWSSWWDFRFVAYGPWTWSAISWGWGTNHAIYSYDRPWYWSRYGRTSLAGRPSRWTGRFRGRPDHPVRLTRPQPATAIEPTTVTRTRTVSPTPLAPTAPATTTDRVRLTPTSPSPVTRPDVRRTAPRDGPPGRVDRTLPPRTEPAPRVPSARTLPPPPTTPPAVPDRRTLDGFRRRGADTLEPRSPRGVPPPNVPPRVSPRVEPPRRTDPPRAIPAVPRVQPATPSPRAAPRATDAPSRTRPDSPRGRSGTPSEEDVRRRRERGRKSLEDQPPVPVPE